MNSKRGLTGTIGTWSARNPGSLAVSFEEVTITCSVGCVPKPARSRVRDATPLSPAPDSDGFSSLVPAMPPITIASTTNAIQPAIAFQGFRALQVPTVPVKPRLAFITCVAPSPKQTCIG